MVIEGTPKFFVNAAELKFNGNDKSTQLSMDFDESLCNGALDVTVTKNLGLHIQDSLSKGSSVKRRSSPRLINIEESRKPNEINNKVIPNTPKKSLVPEVGGEKYGESPLKRRVSPRLREIPESKRPYYGPSRKESHHHHIDEICKELTVNASKIIFEPKVGEERTKESFENRRSSLRLRSIPEIERPYYGPNRNMSKKHNSDAAKQDLVLEVGAIPSSSGSEGVNSKNSRERRVDEINSSCAIARVKETLRVYNKYYLQFLQKTGAANEDAKCSAKRADLKANSKMKRSNEVLYPEKRFGHLPGIGVGYQFYSRSAMAAIGFHSHWLSGIDYMGKCYQKVNNMEQGLPVRVVRGHATKRNAVKVYTYDGLYKVVECWDDKGVSGFVDCKFRLRRLEGQPKLTTNQVQFKKRASRVSRGPNLVCDDISESQEDIHIPATNSIDDAPIPPKGFVYTKSNQVADNVILPPNAVGCKCKGDCTNPKTCACAKLNGSDFPYVHKDGGRLIEAKDVVVECGPNCGCGPSCINRISQQGIKYHLEVFRTENKGWAVKTKDFIPSGAPVCEYIGVLRKTNELDNVAENDYIFEMDCLQTMKEIEGRERRLGDVSASVSKLLEKMDKGTLESSAPEFCIDAGSVGNVARFINHSCEPNLFVQCVLSTHHDLRLARVVLFAADDIAPLEELTYDYGYALDSVIDSNGNIREQPCHCGTAECRKRLY